MALAVNILYYMAKELVTGHNLSVNRGKTIA
jgi:hypothetical protein